MSAKKSTIDQILAQHTPTNKAIASAAAMYSARKEAEQAEQIVANLEQIDEVERRTVEELRAIRKAEKAAKERVLAINKAKEDYLKDADWDKFLKVYRSI